MSTKYSLEAEDNIIAYTAMAIFFERNLPIAIYSPIQHAFMSETALRENESNLKDENFVKSLRAALKSIKEVSL